MLSCRYIEGTWGEVYCGVQDKWAHTHKYQQTYESWLFVGSILNGHHLETKKILNESKAYVYMINVRYLKQNLKLIWYSSFCEITLYRETDTHTPTYSYNFID